MQSIASTLLTIGAVRISTNPPFTWTSGLKAPMYCDNRMLYSHPEARSAVVDLLIKKIQEKNIHCDSTAGTATAAIGWAALVADRMNLPFVYVRSKPKEHGAKKRIEGDLKPGTHVLIVEDLLSTGKSSISTADAIRHEGNCTVSDIVAIVNYELPILPENAASQNLQFHPLVTIRDILNEGVATGIISTEDQTRTLEFLKNPEEWQKQFA